MDDSLHMTIREMPKDDKPREKMMDFGSRVLSDAELIAVLIGSGVGANTDGQGATAIELGRQILNVFDGDLSALYDVSVEELYANPRLKGIGPAKACKIKAALELGHRIHHGKKEYPQISSPDDVAAYLEDSMFGFKQEHFVILLLNTKNRIFKKEEISVGTINSALVHPREVFSRAIRQLASALIVAHNHPSGDPFPSPEDENITKRLVKAGELLGAPVLDHLVIGEQNYFSFKQEGLM